jgi:hypothetical protein
MPATLAERLRAQSAEGARLGSPLYAGLLARAAEDLEAGGVVAEAFAGREDLPGHVVPGLRLLVAAAGTGEWERPVNVRLLEVGTSAGLLLRADRFAYQVGGATLGDPGSPVRLVEPWVGAPFRDPGRMRVRVTERADAAGWLERVLAEPAPPGTDLTVVWHSAVWPYLEREERTGVEAALAAAAERVRREGTAPLARLGLESRRVADRYVFELRLTGWSVAGERHLLLAEAEGHGPPVRWWPAGSVIPAAR